MATNVTKIPQWASTVRNTEIPLYSSQALHLQKDAKPIILIGGVHGDEPEGVRLATDCLLWLTEHTNPSQVFPWIVIPCINPDGYALQQRTNANGVDLNRNYPAQNWSAQAKAPRYNPGPYPGSEKEIQALVTLLLGMQPRLVIHCHSWNPCVVYTGEPAAEAAQKLADASGYEASPDIGYPTPGSLSQWGWHDQRIPIICIEAQENSDLNTVWPRFAPGLQSILKVAGS